MLYIDSETVRQRLTYPVCIELVREAMIRFSSGKTEQLLRSILNLGDARMLGVMPGGLGDGRVFGAKLVSVYPENFSLGKSSHQGVIVLFERNGGAPIGIIDASSVTAIRTAAASAAATDALARADASRLVILGYGEQAHTHALAISEVRKISKCAVWGRSPEQAEKFCKLLSSKIGADVRAAPSVRDAVADADIICTVTAAQEPILKGAWTPSGVHVNVVGSGYAGPTEIDNELVVMSRFFADSKEGVIAQGAEFLNAKKAGLVGDDHIVAEIGEVFSGKAVGRRSAEEITIYKSLGHVVQDLAAASYLAASELNTG